MGSMSEQMARARHRITASDYYRMAEAGILSAADRVELIDGEIVDMAPIGSKHAFIVCRLARFFTIASNDNYLVSTQNPVRLDELSEPQPDLALLKPGNYMDRLPGPADVLLIIEVAHSCINFDREVKLTLYARHGIPEIWLLDLADGELAVYREPVDSQYRVMRKPSASESISPLLVPDVDLRLEVGKSWSVPF